MFGLQVCGVNVCGILFNPYPHRNVFSFPLPPTISMYIKGCHVLWPQASSLSSFVVTRSLLAQKDSCYKPGWEMGKMWEKPALGLCCWQTVKKLCKKHKQQWWLKVVCVRNSSLCECHGFLCFTSETPFTLTRASLSSACYEPLEKLIKLQQGLWLISKMWQTLGYNYLKPNDIGLDVPLKLK